MVITGLLESNQHLKNGDVIEKLHHKPIYLSSVVNYTITHLNLHGISRNPEFINSKHLDVTSTPSPHPLKSSITGQEKYHLWFIPTAELQ